MHVGHMEYNFRIRLTMEGLHPSIVESVRTLIIIGAHHLVGQIMYTFLLLWETVF